MRKPEAAHLLNWFYAIPPYRWFLPFGGSRTLQNSGPQPQYALAVDGCQDGIFGAECRQATVYTAVE